MVGIGSNNSYHLNCGQRIVLVAESFSNRLLISVEWMNTLYGKTDSFDMQKGLEYTRRKLLRLLHTRKMKQPENFLKIIRMENLMFIF